MEIAQPLPHPVADAAKPASPPSAPPAIEALISSSAPPPSSVPPAALAQPTADAPKPVDTPQADPVPKQSWLSNKEAKERYFLSPADLAFVYPEHVKVIPACFGGGPRQCFYLEPALREFAIEIMGQEEFDLKTAARETRLSNKRKKEEEANEATKKYKEMHAAGGAGGGASEAKIEGKVNALRESLLKKCRKSLGAVQHRGHVGRWRVECPNVPQTVFAGLVFRPHDPELRTMVKTGAFYKAEMDPLIFFGLVPPPAPGDEGKEVNSKLRICGVGGRYGSNDQVTVMPGEDVTVRYQPKTMVVSVTGESRIS